MPCAWQLITVTCPPLLAQVPMGLLPCSEQRLHPLDDVRRRRQPASHHHQPRQPIRGSTHPIRQRGIPDARIHCTVLSSHGDEQPHQSNYLYAIQVTHREYAPESEWKNWIWTSEDDEFKSGAFFIQSGTKYRGRQSRYDVIKAKPGSVAGRLTRFSGALQCSPNRPC
ncbi:hypothetical protein B296_00052566 [Ensete ventricosum]|uniref:Uncharacterized protein n=1 Tax=Ensete ventricosum TaxID=4639 RepID=A0A426YBP4_ENSVE|nr:hypothetical protein B296_00052566 [Ensete ventricosum]